MRVIERNKINSALSGNCFSEVMHQSREITRKKHSLHYLYFLEFSADLLSSAVLLSNIHLNITVTQEFLSLAPQFFSVRGPILELKPWRFKNSETR